MTEIYTEWLIGHTEIEGGGIGEWEVRGKVGPAGSEELL
jgi:hypothetical protein